MLFGITSENLIGFGLITLKNTVEAQHHLLKDLDESVYVFDPVWIRENPE